MNLAFIAFILLVFVPPFYNRWEYMHNRDNAIPTQLKWTAQVALGGGVAAHSICRIMGRMRGTNPDSALGAVTCSSLGVAGGAVGINLMVKDWKEEDWEYFGRMKATVREWAGLEPEEEEGFVTLKLKMKDEKEL